MDSLDTLTFAEILVGTTFLGTPTLTVLQKINYESKNFFHIES
jgi:hypothetical protein